MRLALKTLSYGTVHITVATAVAYAFIGDLQQGETTEEITELETIEGHPGFPVSDHNSIVEHTWYTLSYNEKHEQPDWVMYHLSRDNLVRKKHRTELNWCVATRGAHKVIL